MTQPSPPLLPPNMANRAWLISNEYDEAMTTSFCRSKIVVGGMVLVSIRGRKQKVAMLSKYVNCVKHFLICRDYNLNRSTSHMPAILIIANSSGGW